MSKKVPMTFRIYSGDELIQTEERTQDIIKLGTIPSSDLRLQDENVSRLHAAIEVTSDGEVQIIDLGSASGTVVNGTPIKETTTLTSGDELLLGDTKIVVEFSAPVEEAKPAPPAPIAPPSVRPAAAVIEPSVPNPFAAPAVPASLTTTSSHGGHGEDDDPDRYTYAIVQSGPPVNTHEIDTSDATAEVSVMWGRNVLHVEHLSPIEPFIVGDDGVEGVHYLMPQDVIGAPSMSMAVPAGGGVAAVIPAGATGKVTVGDATMTIAELRSSGKLQSQGNTETYPVPHGGTCRVDYKGFSFVTKHVNGTKVIGGESNIDWTPIAYVAGTMATVAIFLFALYFLVPPGSSLNLNANDERNRLAEFAAEVAEMQEEEEEEWIDDSNQQDDSGGKGKRHKGEEGAMGKKEAEVTNNRYAIEGPQDNENPQMAREAAREQARTAGIVGTLAAMQGALNSPTSPFGAATALGNDPTSALGNLMGDQIGESGGFGGLGLTGTGRGGGGTGEGTIGLGNLGTIGHGGGGGDGSGYGRGSGGLRGRTSRQPTIRSGNADVRGSLSREVIRRVVRRHINEVKFCYEQELNSRPDLAGRVVIRFIISPTGAVQNAVRQSSSLNNQRVENCIAGAVRRWTFPAPDGGGVVIVNYPFVLNSGG